jgi:DsbC/DsbD-like thiol-disulfide interchange protein
MHCFNAARLIRVSRALAGFGALAACLLKPEMGAATQIAPLTYEAPHTVIRLFSAGEIEHEGRARRAVGVEITLDTGWKTYWRAPGEGIPPSFSWDESYNLKSAEVLWPAPIRFSDLEGTASIGYKERMVLPVLITPEDPSKPVSVNLAIAYGICKDICMPVEAQLSLDLDAPIRKDDRDRLLQSMASVPKPQTAEASCPHRFLSARVATQADDAPALRVETAHEAKAEERDVIVEAPAELSLPMPVVDRKAPDRTAYLFPLSPESAGAVKGQSLTFIAVSRNGSCETAARVE